MVLCPNVPIVDLVAPFAGAWIEMHLLCMACKYFQSLPSRERGLKSVIVPSNCHYFFVAPFAGAWIEICLPFYNILHTPCRSLRGSVD